MFRERLLRVVSVIAVVFLLCFDTGFTYSALASKTQPKAKFNLSILGDSISTYKNFSNGNAAKTSHSSIKDYLAHYKDGKYGFTVNDTWWMQALNETGGKLLVNNSYSGSKILKPDSSSTSAGYISRCNRLHDNTGSNSGTKPDVIAVYLGTNDFSQHKSTLGEKSAVNYDSLIKKTSSGYKYATPKTATQAYAVTLHKIKTSYPKAEVYCFTILPEWNLSSTDVKKLEAFNSSIKKIASHMGCYTVDLYNNSGIKKESLNNYRYIADKHLHPSKAGMDAITNCFLDSLYKNSKYFKNAEKLYSVSYNLDSNIIIKEGLQKTAFKNSAFSCSLAKLKYGRANVTVTMGSEDISHCYKDGKIIIPRVTGNIKITVGLDSVSRQFNSYRWELSRNLSQSDSVDFANTYELTCVVKNENILNNLYPVLNTPSNPLVSQAVFKTEKTINLYYDKPWQLVWKTTLNTSDSPVIFSKEEIAQTQGNILIHIQENSSVLAIAEYKDGEYHNYGIDLSKYNISYKDAHTFKLVNVPENTGVNTVKLFVDGKEIGKLTSYYINNQYIGSKSNSLTLKNVNLNYIGTADKPLDYSNIRYIQVWENSISSKHIHTYSHSVNGTATCTEKGGNKRICDCSYTVYTSEKKALGHTLGNWTYIQTADENRVGIRYKKCTRCKNTVTTEYIAQKPCATPKLKSVKNNIGKVTVTWSAPSGADAYYVYRKEKGGKWSLLATALSSSYSDTTAKSGKTYYYTVKALNERGASGFQSSGIGIKYLATPKITKLSNTSSGVDICWNKASGAKSYRLYKKNSKGKWELIKITSATSYKDKKVTYGKKYTYTIVAESSGTRSAFYSEFSIKRLGSPKLGKATSSKSGVTVKWSKVTGAEGYLVYKKGSNGKWVRIADVASSKTSYTDKSAKKGKTYIYTVKAYSGSSYSAFDSNGVKIKDKY